MTRSPVRIWLPAPKRVYPQQRIHPFWLLTVNRNISHKMRSILCIEFESGIFYYFPPPAAESNQRKPPNGKGVQNFGFKIVFGLVIGLQSLIWKPFLILILSQPLPSGHLSPFQSVSEFYAFSIQRGKMCGGMFFAFWLKRKICYLVALTWDKSMAMQNILFIVGRWLAAAVFKVQIDICRC